MKNMSGRPQSSNVDDRRDQLASVVLADMSKSGYGRKQRVKNGDSMNAWDYLMSPEPISPTKSTFQKNMNSGTNYSFQARK